MPTYPDIATPIDNLYTVFCLRGKKHGKGKNKDCVISICAGSETTGHSDYYRFIFTKTQVDDLKLDRKTNKLAIDIAALSADVSNLNDPSIVIDCQHLTDVNNKYFKKTARS